MRCRDFRDLAELLRDGALSPTETAAARAHHDSCGDCRGFEEESAALLLPLQGFPPGPYLPPDSPWRTLPPWAGGSGAVSGILLAFLALGGAAALALFGGAAPPAPAPETGVVPSAAPPRETAAAAVSGPPSAPETPAEPALPRGGYSGKIVDEAGAPVVDAAVATPGASPTKTDVAGLFTIGGLSPEGSRLLTVAAPGCVPLMALAPPIRPGTVTVLAAIPVGPARAARVRIVAPDGRPAASARVRATFVVGSPFPDSLPTYRLGNGVESLPVSTEAVAGEDGIAVVEGLGPGKWTFVASAQGSPDSRPATGMAGSGEGPQATVTLERATALEGRVVGPDGRPVGGAEIAWVRSTDRSQSGDLRSEGRGRAGGDGEFRFEAVPEVPLLFRLRLPGSEAWTAAGAADPALTPRVFLQARALGECGGFVVDETGAPVPGLVLLAFAHGSSLASASPDRVPVLTDARGWFTVEGVPEDAVVQVGALRGARLVREPFATIETLRPAVEGKRRPVRARLQRAGSVEGVVRDAAGRPCAGIDVDAFISRSDRAPSYFNMVSTRADAAGRFRLDGILPGDALIVPRPTPPEGRSLMDRIAPADGLGSAADSPHGVRVVAGETVRVEVPPWPAPTVPSRPSVSFPVRGRVRHADGSPPQGVRVFAFLGDARFPDFMRRLPFSPALPVTTDGRFEGSIELPFQPPAGAAMPILVTAYTRDGRSGLTEAKLGPEQGEVEVMIEEGRSLEGRVLDAEGTPIAGALLDAAIAAEANTGFLLPRAATAADGTFRMRGLPAGDLSLFVARPGRPVARLDVPAGSGPSMDLRLPAHGELRGRVVTTGGAPVPDLLIQWQALPPLEPARFATTDEDGRFFFPSVARVSCRITAGSSDSNLDPGAVVQRWVDFPGGTEEALLEVRSAAAVEGVVEDAAGTPAPGAVVTALFLDDGRHRSRDARTDSRGRFSVAGVPPGVEADLRCDHGGLQATGKARAQGESVVLPLSGVLPAATPPIVVDGRVLDASGAPMRGCLVRLLAEDGLEVDLTASRIDGRFVLLGFPGRRFTIEAESGDGRRLYADGVVPGAGETVLRGGGTPGSLGGRVLGADGAPVPGVRVTAVRRGEPGAGYIAISERFEAIGAMGVPLRTTLTAPDGSFDLGSPAGRWVLFAGVPGASRVPAAAIPWDGSAPTTPDLRLGTGWTLRLRAPAASRAAISIAALLPPDAPRLNLSRSVPASGLLEVPGIPPGPVEVVLRDAASNEVGRARIDPRPDDAEPLELPPRDR